MILYNIIFVIVFFVEIHCHVQVISEEPGKLRHSLTDCVLSAAKEFNPGEIITMALTIRDFVNYTNSTMAADRILLKALYNQMSWSLLIIKSKNMSNPQGFSKKSDSYIIQIRDGAEFSITMNYLKERLQWNPHAKFIIISTTIFKDPSTILTKSIKKLSKIRVTNAVFMFPHKNSSSKMYIYSWFPYSNGVCPEQQTSNDIQVINICRYGVFKNTSALFPYKIPNDLNGCPVKVRTIHFPPFIIAPHKIENYSQVNFTKGIEISLLNTIAEVANFSVIYSLSDKDWGYIFRNNTATGLVGAVFKEEVHIGLGALASLLYRHIYFDYSVTYLSESTTWCVPHAMPEPKWKCLLIIFHFSTWSAIFIAYILVSLGIRIISLHSTKEHLSYQTTLNIFQNTYSVMLGVTVKALPKINRIRILIILWTMLCLTLSSACQSSLISFLTQPTFEKQIETFQEMKERGYSFGLVPPTFKFLRNPDKTSTVFNLNSWVMCNNVERCLNRTAYKRDFVVGVPRMYMIYSSTTYINKKGEQLLYWSKNNIITYPVEMIMIKGYPLRRRINQIISRIKEAGLISKWTEDFLKKKKRGRWDEDEENEDVDVILTEKHLEGAFIILGIGLGIAIMVFLCEICCYKDKKLKH